MATHPLSVTKVFKPARMPARTCRRCDRPVVYVVYWKALCRKHALEEFIQNLKGFMEGRAA